MSRLFNILTLIIVLIHFSSIKLNAQNYIWANSIGGSGEEIAKCVDIDGNGNIYVAGSYRTTNLDFDTDSSQNILIGGGFNSSDFISKYDKNGTLIWVKHLTNGGSGTEIEGIKLTNNGLFITGYFSGTNVDFNNGNGITYLSSKGSVDVFFLKCDLNGNTVWAKNVGGVYEDYSSSIDVDGFGNIYLTGYFSSTDADFDPGPLSNLLLNKNPGSEDIFIAKYDSNGNYIWAKSMGGTNSDKANCIKFFKNQFIYITGSYLSSSIDFDPGSSNTNFGRVGGEDLFFAKYDVNGNYLWAKTIGSTLNDRGNSLAIDSLGNLFLTGTFQKNNIDFDLGNGISYLNSNGGEDIFLAKYDVNGNYVWANSFGSTSVDQSTDLKLGSDFNLYMFGFFL